MDLINRIKSAVVRSLTIREPNGWVSDAARADSGELVTFETAMALSAVWACVNLLSGTISTLPLSVYKRDDDTRVDASKHPLYSLLHDSPNFNQTAVDFWELMAASLELKGNAFARKVKTGNRIVALEPIYVEVLVTKNIDGSLRYRWTEDGNSFDVSEADVLHIRGFGGNALGGFSTLHFARNSFGIARAVDKSAGSTFKNGMRPSGALTFEKFLNEEQRKIVEERLVKKFYGAVNSGRPLILEGGTKWEPLTINPEDAQMLESRKFSVEEICRFFGVPPHMVGHTEKNTSFGTGLEQQTLSFIKFTLRRRLKRIEQSINKQLLTPADRAAGFYVEFDLEELLRGDSKARAEYYESGLRVGWFKLNEVRKKEKLPPVPGGDVVRIQMQNVPITEAGNAN
ncbi:phage portal protein, HK97 family [Cohaesibacter marisflavi]|uniref:Phage portal protein, HK97 family n=1 Tax=Cohaesibacter marisflavi TaxID=655353 RepID=A0A1I5ADE1_9HYPH|nr:phage portal protein [Cohaesibacter marisflavi]SFN60418.1 phage portal protein, HK97 family [Cohaesibacter marisflavi]